MTGRRFHSILSTGWARKKTLALALAFFLSCASGSSFAMDKDEQINIFRGKIRALLQKGTLPLIDVEYHHGGKIEITRLLGKMEENGVALVWLGPNEKQGSKESLRLHSAYPDCFVPTTVHGDGKLWHASDRGFLDQLAADVHSGKYFAMGEFEARHYASNTNTRDVHLPVDSAAMKVVFELSSETGIPFLLHHEAEDAVLPELERMLARYPKAKMIWCHVGRNRDPNTWRRFRTADGVREFLQNYPNLYFDLVQSKPGSKYQWTGHVEGILYEGSGGSAGLNKEWRKLFEDFPDRFLFGSDINTGRFGNYDQVINTFRNIVFPGLRKDVAERIAFKNAWKFMTGKEWED
jgi:Amidohydrolase